MAKHDFLQLPQLSDVGNASVGQNALTSVTISVLNFSWVSRVKRSDITLTDLSPMF